MPESDPRTPLDAHLARGRTDLLDRIEQPPLTRIRHRAALRRRRGRNAVTGALAALAVTGTLLVHPWTGAVDPAAPPGTDAPPGGPIYTDAGITVNGLDGPVTDVPGTITDIEFTDPEHGYLLAECVDGTACPASVGRTIDGGASWQVTELPGATLGRTGLDLVAFPDGRLAVAGDTPYTSTDAGRTWQPGTPAGTGSAGRFQPGDRLRAQPGGATADGCGETVRVWRSGQLADVGSLHPGGISVCWVAPDATADGGWWIGGTRGGRTVAALTRDGGATWTEAILDVPGGGTGTVRVAVLGGEAYAVVLGRDGELRALFHSADGGRRFTRTSAGVPVGGPDRMSGELVPLLDGRLLLAGADTHWYVSTDDGHSFTRAAGSLPGVGRLGRTDAGYVAYQLFSNGWVAYSADGSTWRKLQIR